MTPDGMDLDCVVTVIQGVSLPWVRAPEAKIESELLVADDSSAWIEGAFDSAWTDGALTHVNEMLEDCRSGLYDGGHQRFGWATPTRFQSGRRLGVRSTRSGSSTRHVATMAAPDRVVVGKLLDVTKQVFFDPRPIWFPDTQVRLRAVS